MYRGDWQIFGRKTYWKIWRRGYQNMRQWGNFWQRLGKSQKRRRGIGKSSRVEDVRARKKTIEKFVQEFQRVASSSGYERRPLVEEFKRR